MKTIILNSRQLNIIQEYIKKNLNLGLPMEVVKQLELNQTSLGNNPAFPPADEHKFEYKLLSKHYQQIINNLNTIYPNKDINDVDFYKSELSRILKKCYDLEKPLRFNLERLCFDIVMGLFGANEETDFILTIQMVDVVDVDMVKQPLVPESYEDIEFDGIEDVEGINDEIYKRRVINSLISGVSNWYVHNPIIFIQELYKLNPKLVPIYAETLTLNEFLLYQENANTYSNNKVMRGATSEVIVKSNERSIINVQGVNFISLLHESIRAVFDLISSNGLPKDRRKINYILKKSDFLLANSWDNRFGLPLWNLIVNKIPEGQVKELSPFLFYELVKKPVDEFNTSLQNIFANTKKGKEIITSLCGTIKHSMDKEAFDLELNNKRQIHLNDSRYLDL